MARRGNQRRPEKDQRRLEKDQRRLEAGEGPAKAGGEKQEAKSSRASCWKKGKKVRVSKVKGPWAGEGKYLLKLSFGYAMAQQTAQQR